MVDRIGQMRDVIELQIGGAEVVLLLTGLGGRVGSWAAPEIAKIAKATGAFVISLAYLPFEFESPRVQLALESLELMKLNSDIVLPVPCESCFEVFGGEVGMRDVFRYLDYAPTAAFGCLDGEGSTFQAPDALRAFKVKGEHAVGWGIGLQNAHACEDAAWQAIHHPLLGPRRVRQATDVLITVRAPGSYPGSKAAEVVGRIRQATGPSARVIATRQTDDRLANKMFVGIIASGINFD